MEGNKKIKLTTIIGIVVVMAIIIGVGIFIFKNRKASKVQNNNVNNTQNIGNNKIEEEKVKLNKIYTNFTNSKKLNSIDIGLYNDENKQYFKILSVNMPDCYLISRLYYTEGPDDLFLENYIRPVLRGKNMDLIEAIVQLEWKQFDKVQNEGGRADCQDDYQTFSIMRKSQYMTWPEELLSSFYGD